MKRSLFLASAALAATISLAAAQDNAMSFFITSQGLGNGANLGGLEGADAHCQSLAEAAGSSGKTWRAYLSTSTENAKDRIGSGPWSNQKGEKIADDVASLHSDANAITKETALNEKGEMVSGRGDQPNRHDILTGSMPDGTVAADQTCGDWTLGGAEGRRWSAITTAWASTILRRPSHGTLRTPRAAAAAWRRSRAPAATACSTASPPTDPTRHIRAAGRCGSAVTNSSGFWLMVWNTTQ
jgi:hypothetical protein